MIIVGTDDPETLTGGEERDSIEGMGGNDWIMGNGGRDTLSGGEGDDHISGGADRVGDLLDGGAGEDVLTGGLHDTLLGGEGANEFILDFSNVGSGVVLNFTTTAGGEWTGAGGTHLSGYFYSGKVLLGRGDDVVREGDQCRVAIDGGGGNDLLIGNFFHDWFEGGGGSDTIRGGEGQDIASYAGAGSRVRVDLGERGLQRTGGGGVDQLSGVEDLVGSAFDDVLIGEQGVGNYLFGGAGDDILVGNTGDGVYSEYLAGGAGSDTFRYEDLTYSTTQWNYADANVADGDVVNLSRMDANLNRAGDQDFRLVEGFTGRAGEAWFYFSGVDTRLELDRDGDGYADAIILLGEGDQRAIDLVL